MNWIRRFSGTIFELFVDDGSLVLGVLVWLALFKVVAVYLRSHAVNGLLLAAALGLSLASSVLYFARHHGANR